VGAFIVLPLLRLPSLDGLAVRIDDALAPGVNPLISSLQLGRRLREKDEGGSVSRPIMRMAVKAGVEKTRGMDSRPVTADRFFGKWIRQLAVVAVTALALIALWPGQLRTSAWRLTHPYACGPAPIQIAVAPGDAELDAGSDLKIEALVTGTSKPPVLRLRKRGGVWRRAEMREISRPDVQAQALLAVASSAGNMWPSDGPRSGALAPDEESDTEEPAVVSSDGKERRQFPSSGGNQAEHPSSGGDVEGSEELSPPACDQGQIPVPSDHPGAGRLRGGVPELPRRFYAVTLNGLQEDREYYVAVEDELSETWNIKVNHKLQP
jgi:hypothetical protein